MRETEKRETERREGERREHLEGERGRDGEKRETERKKEREERETACARGGGHIWDILGYIWDMLGHIWDRGKRDSVCTGGWKGGGEGAGERERERVPAGGYAVSVWGGALMTEGEDREGGG